MESIISKPAQPPKKIAAQLEIPLQNGSHPWINDTIRGLFEDEKANARWVAANAATANDNEAWCGPAFNLEIAA